MMARAGKPTAGQSNKRQHITAPRRARSPRRSSLTRNDEIRNKLANPNLNKLKCSIRALCGSSARMLHLDSKIFKKDVLN